MPPFNSCTIFSVFLLLHFSKTTGVNFTLVNKCSETIWPAMISKDTGLSSGEVQLSQNRSFEYQTSNLWSGRFWGKPAAPSKTRSTSPAEPASAVPRGHTDRIHPRSQHGLLRDYDVSLVNGYNLPVMVQPVGWSGQCRPTGCPNDLILKCPQELRMKGGACGSACDVFNTTEYCCTGEYNSPDKCRPSKYSQVFQEVCPNAYSYAYTCAAKADYTTLGYNQYLQFKLRHTPAYAGEDNPSTGYGSPGGSSAAAKNYSMFTIVVAIDIITVLVITSIVIYWLIRRLHLKPPWKKSRQDIEKILAQHGSLTPKRYTYSQIKKITKSFSDKLGQGGCGSVYKGILRDSSPVAVKVLAETDSSDGEEFINEVISISRTSHVNIVSLLGFCYEGNRRALVYEYMAKQIIGQVSL